MLKKSSAWLPIVMSLAILVIIVIDIIIFGIPARSADEGTAAHLFQIWLVLEVLIVVFFILKWLPRNPKPALMVLSLQVITALPPLAIVFFLKL